MDKYWFVIRKKDATDPELYGPFSTRVQAEQAQQAIWMYRVFGDDTFPVYSAPNESEAKEHFHFKSLMTK